VLPSGAPDEQEIEKQHALHRHDQAARAEEIDRADRAATANVIDNAVRLMVYCGVIDELDHATDWFLRSFQHVREFRAQIPRQGHPAALDQEESLSGG
jgi:hypothetical protein